MKHIGIIGSFGSGNLGDEAAWQAIKRFLITKDPRYKYHTHVFQWSSPYQTCGYHAEPVYILTHKELEWINNNFEAMIITGGGIVGWDWGLSKTRGIDKIINGLKIPLYTISISAEKGEYNEEIKANIKAIMDKSKIFTVRDTYSQENIKNITGITPEITPDIVSILGEEYPIHKSKLDKLKDTLMINASNCLTPELIEFYSKLYMDLNGKENISCIPFAPCFNDVALAIKTQQDMHFGFYMPSEMISIMKSKKFVIAGRLHAAVFSATAGVPFFAINYHPKVKAFCDSINYPYYYPKTNDLPEDFTKYGFDIKSFNYDEMFKQLKAHMDNPVKPPKYHTAMILCESVYNDIKGISLQQIEKNSTPTNCMYCGEDIVLEGFFTKCEKCNNINQNEKYQPDTK